jgi:hypothetical protein
LGSRRGCCFGRNQNNNNNKHFSLRSTRPWATRSTTTGTFSVCYSSTPARTTWTRSAARTTCEHANVAVLTQFWRRFRSEFIGNGSKTAKFEFLIFLFKFVGREPEES